MSNNNNNNNNYKTDVQEVKRLNALSQQGGNQGSGLPMQGTMAEFGSEYATDVQEVKRQNAQSEAKKNQNYQK